MEIFQGKGVKLQEEKAKMIDELYRQIGQLKVENEWLKKNLHSLSVDDKRRLIEGDHKGLSIRRQCELLGLHRSNIYYEPVGVSDETIEVMHRIDGIFTESPFYGSRRIREALRREGICISRERVQSLMRQMGFCRKNE